MWFEYARAIFATATVAVAAFGIGSPISRLLPETIPAWSRRVCCWIAGFGILGVALFVIGQWKLSRFTIGMVVDLGILAAIINALREHWFPLKWRPRISRSQIIPAAIVAAVLLITAIGGLAEPVGDWGDDGVAYHLLGPKVWLRNGIVRPVPDNTNTAYPVAAEMVFSALMAQGGQRAPGFSAVLTFSVLLLIAASLALRCGLNATGAWWSAALIAAMPAVYEGAHSGFVDVIYAAFALAAARIAFDAERSPHFAALGLFCGLAIATKYTGLLATPAIILIAVWPRRNGITPKMEEILRRAGIAAAVASAVALPFYLRNWVVLGSPIYPPPASVAKFLHIKYLSADALRGFYAYSLNRGRGHGRSIVALMMLPFNLTYHTADFNGAGGIGLAPLALAPLGVIAAWRNAFSRRIAILAAVLTLLWFVTMQESRYLIHVYAIAAIFAVLGWRYIGSLRGSPGTALGAMVVAVSLLYGLRPIAASRRSDIRSVFSQSYADARRSDKIPFVQSFDLLNRDPAVTRLLILDPSGLPYYSDKDYLKPFGQWGEQVLPDARTPSEVLAQLDQLHISHILDVRSTVSGFRVPQNDPRLILTFDQPDERVYAVRDATQRQP
jgi:hypothetical protein